LSFAIALPIWPIEMMIEQLRFLEFASDATIAMLAGGAFLLAAGLSMWAEARRTKRRHIDAVGWMPWTKLFFIFTLTGLTMLVMGVKGWGAG